MQIAEILSDLTSLRACNHDEALALVHTNTTLHVPEPPNPSPAKGRKRSGTSKSEIRDPYSSRPASTTLGSAGKSSGTKAERGAEEDPDLRRAIDLVELHCSVKVKRLQGADLGLQRARGDVDEVLRKLRGGEGDVVQRR